MDEIALIRALASDDERSDPSARAAARKALDAGIGSASSASSRRASSPRRRLLALGGTVALVTAAIVALFAAGQDSGSPQPAYGAELVRFAESTPLLLLEDPGWRVQYVNEYRRSPEGGAEGTMEFVTGSPASLEAHLTRYQHKHHLVPPTVRKSRQSRVELNWHDGKQYKLVWHDGRLGQSAYNSYLGKRVTYFEPGRSFKATIPALGTTAYIDPRSENIALAGGPGDRLMVAMWTEGGHLLELRADVPNLAAFRERLSWLHRVDAQTWLDAMPTQVVKSAEHDAAVREMLKGVPVPSTFKPSRVPGAGLTADRYQVGAAVAGTVSCLWFRQWGEARRSGDRAKAAEAERAMATATRWPVLRQMEREGGYPETILKLARSMPSGVWIFGPHRWRLLPKAEGLGCARWGIPVLPWKQQRQRERGNL